MIREVDLTNFKCFERQRVELAPLNLLSGLNGMGKSTFLQALLLLRQSHQQSVLAETGLALNGDLVSIGTARDALFRGAQEDLIGIGLRWTDELGADWTFEYNRTSDILTSIASPSNESVFGKSLFRDNFQYLSAERIGPRTSFAMSEQAVRHHRQLGTQGEYTVHFLVEFGGELLPNPELTHPNATSGSLRANVEAWMSEVSPGTRLHLDPHPELDLVGLQFSAEAGALPSEPVRPTNFGFGVTYVLPVLTSILAARSGTLLLIENPEAHLHPRGQVAMGKLLADAAAGGVQVIAETHSDHVLNGTRIAVHQGLIKPEDVRLNYFRRATEGAAATAELVTPRIDRNGRIDQWPEGFFDEWSKSLDDLLFPAV